MHASVCTPDFDGRVSVVVPLRDEVANVLPLLDEIDAALAGRADYEVVCVDDGSRDGTAELLLQLARDRPWLRVLRHGRSFGQSTALASAIRAARHPWIATLDGDGQNDPADVPRLLAQVSRGARQPDVELVIGWRTQRHDDALRRASSRVANAVRATLLGDATPDTGCGLKVFGRDTWLRLPFFDHQHRFLPALFLREGVRVKSVPVRHRPRRSGRSHYGVHDRLWAGIVDLLGVMWLQRRMKRPQVDA